MPWFGQGGKKSKPVQTELQNQRRCQIEALKHGSLNVVETLKDVEYRVTFIVHDSNVTLIVNLPPQFPQDKPCVKVEPGVRHPWVDQNMFVTGCPSLNSFTVHSSLFTAVQSIVQEFSNNPPAIAHLVLFQFTVHSSLFTAVQSIVQEFSNNPPAIAHSSFNQQQPVGRGFPSLFPVTTNIFNIYPSMSPQTVQSQITEPASTSSQIPQSEIPTMNGNNGSIPDFSQIDIWTAFPDLKNMSNIELMALTEEEDKILEMIQGLPQIQTVAETREKMSCQCTELAKENLSKRPVIEEVKQSLRDKYKELECVRSSFETNQERQLSLSDQFEPSVIQNNLKVAVLEAEEDSDKAVDEFLEKKIEIEEFTKRFLDKRTLYHERKSKEEKMNVM